jgi:hypothetical protein
VTTNNGAVASSLALHESLPVRLLSLALSIITKAYKGGVARALRGAAPRTRESCGQSFRERILHCMQCHAGHLLVAVYESESCCNQGR